MRLSDWLIRSTLRAFLVAYLVTVHIAKVIGRRTRMKEDVGGWDILLTGTFYSRNWIRAHVQPLTRCRHFRSIRVVSVLPLQDLERIEVVCPSQWLMKLCGRVPSRLIVFAWTALRTRPHIVGGFHLLFNGLASLLLGKMFGLKALYISTGGPVEVLGGGILSENRLFSRLGTADRLLENLLLKAVSGFDIVVTRGKRAKEFFGRNGAPSRIHIIPGGVESGTYYPSSSAPENDLIFVGRLSEVKRLEILLYAVRHLADRLQKVKMLIVGDGPLRDSLKALSSGLGIAKNVNFVGHQTEVEGYLRSAKVFVLTSETEGLSLSMIEAMLCGLPVVVPDVGDLGDLVLDGVNGFLVRDSRPEEFADCCEKLLTDPNLLTSFGVEAHRAASRCELKNVAKLWEDLLISLMDSPEVDNIPPVFKTVGRFGQ